MLALCTAATSNDVLLPDDVISRNKLGCRAGSLQACRALIPTSLYMHFEEEEEEKKNTTIAPKKAPSCFLPTIPFNSSAIRFICPHSCRIKMPRKLNLAEVSLALRFESVKATGPSCMYLREPTSAKWLSFRPCIYVLHLPKLIEFEARERSKQPNRVSCPLLLLTPSTFNATAPNKLALVAMP